MGVQQDRVFLLCLFGLWPSALLFRSATLRESFQGAMVLWSFLAVLRLRESKRFRHFVPLLLSAIFLTLLHYALLVYGTFMLVLGGYWAFSRRRGRAVRLKRWAVVAAIATLLLVSLPLARRYGGHNTLLLGGGVVERLSRFREATSVIGGRASYGNAVQPTTAAGVALNLPVLMFYYLFAPLPWQIATRGDMVAGVESLLRALLLLAAVRSALGKKGEHRERQRFGLLAFFVLETVWAVGSLNWGTAIRHRLPALGLLIVLGGPGLVRGLRAALSLLLPVRTAAATRSRKAGAPVLHKPR